MIPLQVLLAYLYSHVLEYYAHKFLHLFTKSDQLLAFHMREHHVRAKRQLMSDTPSGKEGFYLGLLLLFHLPLAWFSPAGYITLAACSAWYLYVHTRAHLDPHWAGKHLPWHAHHHLSNQQANWGVRRNWVDKLLGTDCT